VGYLSDRGHDHPESAQKETGKNLRSSVDYLFGRGQEDAQKETGNLGYHSYHLEDVLFSLKYEKMNHVGYLDDQNLYFPVNVRMETGNFVHHKPGHLPEQDFLFFGITPIIPGHV